MISVMGVVSGGGGRKVQPFRVSRCYKLLLRVQCKEDRYTKWYFTRALVQEMCFASGEYVEDATFIHTLQMGYKVEWS